MGIIRRLTIYTDKIKKKMKILSYSDLHLVVNKRGNIDEILRVERLSPENYDCIVMPGDIVHYASTYESKENFDKVAKDLKRITGSTPVFYVLGNHDQKNWYFCSKGKDGKLNAGIRDALEKLDSLGNFTWLSNGKVFKYGEIELKGINNSSKLKQKIFRVKKRGKSQIATIFNLF